MPRPMFNVCEEFCGVTTIQINREFRWLMLSFLGDIEDGDIEVEILAFKNALNDPVRSRQLRDLRRRKAELVGGSSEYSNSNQNQHD